MRNGLNPEATDIVIPVRNDFPSTRNLLEGIYRFTDRPFHIFLIDNGSTDETADADKVYTRDITVVHNRDDYGWCRGINQGVRLGCGPNVVFMKNNVEVSQGWLDNLISFLDTHPRIGAVGPLNSNPDNWQCVDRVRSTLVSQMPEFLTVDIHERNRILDYHFHRAGILVDRVLATLCMALKRRVIDEVGLLDEGIGDGSGADEFCRRLRKAGYVCGLSLDTYIVHRSGALHRSRSGAERHRGHRRKDPGSFREKSSEHVGTSGRR